MGQMEPGEGQGIELVSAMLIIPTEINAASAKSTSASSTSISDKWFWVNFASLFHLSP